MGELCWASYAPRVLPPGVRSVQDQWKAWRSKPFPLEQPEAADTLAFSGLYGPALANLRARSLRGAHAGWEVFGKWLWSQLEEPVEWRQAKEWLGLGKAVLEAGIFFDSVDMMEVLLKCAGRFEGLGTWTLVGRQSHNWYVPSEGRGSSSAVGGVTTAADAVPSPLWHLYLQPHLQDIIHGQLRHFPCSCRYSEEDRDCPYGWGLWSVLFWLPRSRRVAYLIELCLMMDSLSCRLKDMGNVALDTILYSDHCLPRPYIGKVVDKLLASTSAVTFTALLALLGRTPSADAPALRNALNPVVVNQLLSKATRLRRWPPALVLILIAAQVELDDEMLRMVREGINKGLSLDDRRALYRALAQRRLTEGKHRELISRLMIT